MQSHIQSGDRSIQHTRRTLRHVYNHAVIHACIHEPRHACALAAMHISKHEVIPVYTPTAIYMVANRPTGLQTNTPTSHQSIHPAVGSVYTQPSRTTLNQSLQQIPKHAAHLYCTYMYFQLETLTARTLYPPPHVHTFIYTYTDAAVCSHACGDEVVCAAIAVYEITCASVSLVCNRLA